MTGFLVPGGRRATIEGTGFADLGGFREVLLQFSRKYLAIEPGAAR